MKINNTTLPNFYIKNFKGQSLHFNHFYRELKMETIILVL